MVSRLSDVREHCEWDVKTERLQDSRASAAETVRRNIKNSVMNPIPDGYLFADVADHVHGVHRSYEIEELRFDRVEAVDDVSVRVEGSTWRERGIED